MFQCTFKDILSIGIVLGVMFAFVSAVAYLLDLSEVRKINELIRNKKE